MKTYAIKDDTIEHDFTVAYLNYYETDKSANIEICKDIDAWDLPMILEHFVRKKQWTVPNFWTRKWVQQRVVPPDRQNIAQILLNCGMSGYDEYELLFHTDGRCAQDDCYIQKINKDELPLEIKERQTQNISDVYFGDNQDIIITLANDEIYTIEMAQVQNDYAFIKRIAAYADRLSAFNITGGGSCLSWGDSNEISREYIIENGQKSPISAAILLRMAQNQIVSTTEAMKMLNCTRQNINDLVKRGRLHPLDMNAKTKLFMKKEVLGLVLT